MPKLNPLNHPICFDMPSRLTPGSAWHEHIPFGMLLVDLLRPNMIVELGTQYGDSYCAFCQAVKELKLNTSCYAVDTWQGDPHSGLYGSEILADLRAHHDPIYGSFSRLIQSTFDGALEHFAAGTVDLLHIDGYHTYQSVKHDFESWLPKMNPHGVVLFHDTNVRERDFGIRRFWDEIKLKYPHFEFLHGHGLGILAVSKVRSRELHELFQLPEEDMTRIRDFFFQLGHQLTTRVRDEARTSELENQKGHLQALQADLESRDARIADLDTGLQEKVAQISTLETSLQEKVAQISTLETSLQEKVAQISTLEVQIQQMQRGIVMQLLTRYQRVIEKLLRPGTRRRHYYELGLTGIRVILNEGWGSFWFKFRRWIKQRTNLFQGDTYKRWILQNEPKEEELQRQKQESLSFKYRPKISIITPVWNTDEKWLRLAIESVINQTYDNWELCLADGNSTKPDVKQILQDYARKDSRIKVKFLPENKGIAGNSNEALSLATGEFIGLLDHDDELAAFALYECLKLLNDKQEIDFIFSDEDNITAVGKRFTPYFKPDWSPDMFLSSMYTCHFGIYRKKIIDEIGGFRAGYDGSQDYDLVLRFIERTHKIQHIPKVLYHWRIIPESVTSSPGAKPYAYLAARRALTDYLMRNNIRGEVVDGARLGSYRVRREIIGNPLVSIVIPTRDAAHILRKCINSVSQKSEYDNYEILIVDNQSVEPATFDYYDRIRACPKIRILEYNKPFNFSAINNYAVSEARGEHILFLNNDTEVISTEWLSAMLEHSQRKEVGGVGAKLLFPDGSIQHCGVILGLGQFKGYRVAGHIYRRSRDTFGYFGRVSIISNYSAVTAACMMLRKEVFDKVGGFDENLSVGYNDVDLCLKIRERGYLIVYTPYAQLYHHEFYSRGYDYTPEKQARALKEVEYMRARWGQVIDKGDPYYNPNLTLYRGDFSIRLAGD